MLLSVVADDDRLLVTGSVAGVFVDTARRIARPGQKADRVLTTILVTDIVSSSGHADRLGDEGWRELLSRHNDVVRGAIASHSGSEVKTTGDGFLVRFDCTVKDLAIGSALVFEHRGEHELKGIPGTWQVYAAGA